jgi:hypothetical protein
LEDYDYKPVWEEKVHKTPNSGGKIWMWLHMSVNTASVGSIEQEEHMLFYAKSNIKYLQNNQGERTRGMDPMVENHLSIWDILRSTSVK